MTADYQKLHDLPAYLESRIRGQAHVIPTVVSVLRRGACGLAHPRRPKGSLLFVGPTGVGKTELASVFTAFLFAGDRPVRFDMSEYQLHGSVDKLIGENAGDSGLLGRALCGRFCGTLLFDEVEKAHPLVLDLLLQILDEGRITLATGEAVDLRGYYIVLTSNIGAAEAMRMQSAPFSSVERTVLMRVDQTLRPELVGRITERVVFKRLDYATQREICEQMVAAEASRLSELGHAVSISSDELESLVRVGFHRTLGARPMRTTVERRMQDAVVGRLFEDFKARQLSKNSSRASD